MIRCADTVKAKPRRVFSQKSSNIHNVPTGGYSSLWNQDIKLVQMQLCTRAHSPQASQVFCVLSSLIKYRMSRFEKIIVTNRPVIGINVVYCTSLIVQFLLVKKKEKKKKCSVPFGIILWIQSLEMTLTCSGAFWVRRECSLLKDSILNTCRILKEVFQNYSRTGLSSFSYYVQRPSDKSTKEFNEIKIFIFFFPAFWGLSYVLKQACCPLIISCAREPARQFHNSNLWHLHLLWGCPTKHTLTPTRVNKHCSGRHHLALFFFVVFFLEITVNPSTYWYEEVLDGASIVTSGLPNLQNWGQCLLEYLYRSLCQLNIR